MGVCRYSSQLQFRRQAKTLGMIMAITLGLCSVGNGISTIKGENKADHVPRYLQLLNESVPAEATEREFQSTPSVSLPSANASSTTPVHLEAEQAKNTTALAELDSRFPAFNNVTGVEVDSSAPPSANASSTTPVHLAEQARNTTAPVVDSRRPGLLASLFNAINDVEADSSARDSRADIAPPANASSTTPVHLEAEQAKNTTALAELDSRFPAFNNVTGVDADSSAPPSANVLSTTPVHLAEQARNTTTPVGLDAFFALLFNNFTDAEADSEGAEEGIAQNSSAIASRADKLAQAFTEGSAGTLDTVQVGDLDVGQSDEQEVEESDSGSEDSSDSGSEDSSDSDDCNSDDSADSGSEDSDSVSVGDSDSDSDSVSVSCNESSKIMNRDEFSRGNLTTM